MNNSEILNFTTIFLRKEFSDKNIKYQTKIEFLDEEIHILYSEKMRYFILLINLQRLSKMIDFKKLYEIFYEKHGEKEIKENGGNEGVLFCLLTFKNKFIIYKYEEMQEIYVFIFIWTLKILFFLEFICIKKGT